eukprot:6287516-Alexandrium_andersonii.AAC.1
MSASLVGSEMCIRDRPYVCRALVARNSNLAGRLRQLKALTAPHVLHPVSYTHLTLPTICSV